mgnify:CR=1 FL=1
MSIVSAVRSWIAAAWMAARRTCGQTGACTVPDWLSVHVHGAPSVTPVPSLHVPWHRLVPSVKGQARQYRVVS